MKAFLVTSGTVFALVVVAHILRLGFEPDKSKDPFFVLLTVAAGALSFWAWRLVWQMRRS